MRVCVCVCVCRCVRAFVCVRARAHVRVRICVEDVLFIEFVYLVFTRMPGYSCCGRYIYNRCSVLVSTFRLVTSVEHFIPIR